MPDEMNAIKSLPDISFIDNKDIDQVGTSMSFRHSLALFTAPTSAGQSAAKKKRHSSLHRFFLNSMRRNGDVFNLYFQPFRPRA